MQPVARRDSLSLCVTSAADVAVVLGSLSNNSALQRLELPLIFGYNGRQIFDNGRAPTDRVVQMARMAAVEGLGEMLVQLGQAIRYDNPDETPGP